jgi:hypothetical protein
VAEDIQCFIEADTGIPYFPINEVLISNHTGQVVSFDSNPRLLTEIDTGNQFLCINDSGLRFIVRVYP